MKIKTSIPREDYSYRWIFWIGVAVFFLSNAYFGWNETAQSGAERFWDVVWIMLGFVGGLGMFVREIVVGVFKEMEIEIEGVRVVSKEEIPRHTHGTVV